MQFAKTWKQVLDGSKTQTRRLVKPGEYYCPHREYIPGEQSSALAHVFTMKDGAVSRFVYLEGHTYAVQPGRGQKAVGRIKITGIRRERLQGISEADAHAEGWVRPYFGEGRNIVEAYADLWDSIHTKPGTRWEDSPDVWVLSFELVEATP